MARDKQPSEEHDPTLGPAVTAVHVGGESIVDRLLPHAKKIGLALLGAALIVTAVFTWRWYQHRKAEKATSKVIAALAVLDRPVKPGPDEMPLDPKREAEAFADDAARDSAALDAFARTGQARGAGALVEAQLLARTGKLDAALAIYRKHAAAKGVDGLLAREGVGVVLESQAAAATDPAARQKLLEDALAAYRAIQTDDKGLRRDYALYHEGRLLEALGKNAEAKAALEKALAVVPDSALEPVIRNRLSALGEGT